VLARAAVGGPALPGDLALFAALLPPRGDG